MLTSEIIALKNKSLYKSFLMDDLSETYVDSL